MPVPLHLAMQSTASHHPSGMLLLLPELVLPSCWFTPPCLLDITSTDRLIVAMFFNVTVTMVVTCPFGFSKDSWSAYGVKYTRVKPGVGTGTVHMLAPVSYVIVFICWVPCRVLSTLNTSLKVLMSLVTICTYNQCHCHTNLACPLEVALGCDKWCSEVSHRNLL